MKKSSFLVILNTLVSFILLMYNSYANNIVSGFPIPPVHAERMTMQVVKLRWSGDMRDWNLEYDKFEGAIDSDTLYLKLVNFSIPYGYYQDWPDYTYPESDSTGWIKGIVNSNKFTIPNADSLFVSLLVLKNVRDSLPVYSFGANFGKPEYHSSYNLRGELEEENFSMKVWLTNQNISCEINPATKLITQPNTGILIAPERLNEITYHYQWDPFEKPELTYHTEAIKDFIIGCPSSTPQSLPTPRLEIIDISKNENESKYRSAVFLDLVTEDEYVLDTDRLFIVYYLDKAYYGTSHFTSDGSPFSHFIPSNGKIVPEELIPEFKVFCYYVLDDGSRLLSEWVDVNGTVAIPPVEAEEIIYDISDIVQQDLYDLNGRRILNTENLEPGIYIRGGKKYLLK